MIALIVGSGIVISGGSDTCYTDRAILRKGIQGAYHALKSNNVARAQYIIEQTAEATGTELP